MIHSSGSGTGTRDILEAYRTDQRARAGEPFGEADGAWVQLGLLLTHAASVPVGDRGALLRAAAEVGRALLGDERWQRGFRTDPAPPTDGLSLASRIRTIAETIEEVGALNLADAILGAYVASDERATPLEHGRVEVMRARLAMKTGNADAATERYRRAMSVARQLKSIELRTRVLVGRAIMARLGGNNPRARTLARSAATTAERAGHDRLASVAHVTSMVIEAASGRFDEAVLHGWRGYTLATGDAVLQSEILANLGQLFLEAGHPQTALSAFRAVLAARVGPRIELLVLGGMALASAFVGQRIAVDEIDAAIMRFADVHAPPHDVASSMLELARARQWLGETASADRLRRRSLQLAERYGYHEIAHNAAAEFSAPEPSRNLSPRVETVAHAVRELVNA